MTEFKTPQEEFWAGTFGDEYIARNKSQSWVARNIALFSQILSGTEEVGSILEYGANIGLNLIALRHLLPSAQLAAVEINEKAVQELKRLSYIYTYHSSLLEFSPKQAYDLVLTKGVLIHLNPDELPGAYELLYRTAKRYICLAEYYNPTPVAITYHGHTERLFKRDFAGEMLDRFRDLRLAKYGFVYHRDNLFPQDDINWFLLEKRTPPSDGCF